MSASEPDGRTQTAGGLDGEETVYAISYPPAMYARDILTNPTFAAAMGYGWLHEEDTKFVRAFREQVGKQAELYQKWLDSDA